MSGQNLSPASLRMRAREAREEQRWGAAAILYREAARCLEERRGYEESELAQRDAAQLRESGDECARTAHQEAHADYRSATHVLALCPLSGATVSIPIRLEGT